jgi:protein-arginine kinase activator protein McsA
VLDILLELLELLGFVALKKKKKNETEQASPKTYDSIHEQHGAGGIPTERISTCAGCRRTLDRSAIYELGEAWCIECYKTNVLKVKE